jgi:hypothetical protein
VKRNDDGGFPMSDNVNMTPELAKVCDKVRKLLALSGNNPNENEMRAAAAAADRLMQEYRITQAMLESEGSAQSEPFTSKVVCEAGRRTAWREVVLSALTDHYGCCWYYESYRVGGEHSAGAPGSKGHAAYTVVGRKSDVDIVDYMFTWAVREVERLCRWHAGGQGVKYAMAWQMGCARGLRSQFSDMRAAARAQASAQGGSTALAVLDKRQDDTRAHMNSTMHLKKGAAVHGAHDAVASSEGYSVGRKIQIRQGIGGGGGSTPAGSLGR